MLTRHLSDNYQEFTRSTICYSNKDALNYLVMGLISEMAEFVSYSDTESEAGDVCWYIFRIVDNFGKNFYDEYHKAVLYSSDSFAESISRIASLHKKYIRGDRIQSYPNKLINLVVNEFFYLERYFGKGAIPGILLKNKDKLIERQNKGVIRGSGETIEERERTYVT